MELLIADPYFFAAVEAIAANQCMMDKILLPTGEIFALLAANPTVLALIAGNLAG